MMSNQFTWTFTKTVLLRQRNVPFLETMIQPLYHGTNMQRQAVPLIDPRTVGTIVEYKQPTILNSAVIAQL